MELSSANNKLNNNDCLDVDQVIEFFCLAAAFFTLSQTSQAPW